MTVTAVTQRARRTHPLVVLLRLLVVLALAGAVVLGTLIAVAPTPSIAATRLDAPPPPAAEPTIAWPEAARAAAYAVVGEPDARGAWGSDAPVPMASLAKLVTVLVVLEAHPLDDDERGPEIVLGRDDVNALGRAIAERAPIAVVHDGMVVTQRDLIEWSLVTSAGNASWSLAHWAFGSIDAFLEATAAWAERNGFTGMRVADPAGLDVASVATAAELAQVGLLAVEHPVVLASMQLPSVAVPGVGAAPNTNRIQGQGFIDGGKTGMLFVWGRNLLATAVRVVDGRPERVVGVVLGTVTADAVNEGMLGLIDSLWDEFGEVEVLPAGTPVGEYRAPWGEVVTAATTTPLAVDAFTGLAPSAEVSLEAVRVDVPRGTVGTAVAEATSGERSETTVMTDGILDGPDLAWRIEHAPEVLAWYLAQP